MSVSTEIDRLKKSKADIIDAIEEKGVAVDIAATMDDMAGYILQIDKGFQSVLSSTQPTSQNIGDFWLKIK